METNERQENPISKEELTDLLRNVQLAQKRYLDLAQYLHGRIFAVKRTPEIEAYLTELLGQGPAQFAGLESYYATDKIAEHLLEMTGNKKER